MTRRFTSAMNEIKLKRAYDTASPQDGYRVLVDRIWPRGVSKEKASVDEWPKEAAPSNELRKWFHAHRSQWDEFKRRYRAELDAHRQTLESLAARLADGPVTLVYSSRNTEQNNAVVLKEYLEELAAG